MTKKVSMFLVAAVATLGLTACGVSDEEVSACQAEGGSIVEKSFPIPGNHSWYEPTKTEDFTFCASSTGRIIKLYKIGAQKPADPKANFLSSEGEWTRKCMDEGVQPGRLSRASRATVTSV